MWDNASGKKLEATELGVLQTTENWASFTARVRSQPGNEDQTALVIIEQADPFVDGGPATVAVFVDGAPYAAGRLAPNAVQVRTAR